jgi:hypothetical protein
VPQRPGIGGQVLRLQGLLPRQLAFCELERSARLLIALECCRVSSDRDQRVAAADFLTGANVELDYLTWMREADTDHRLLARRYRSIGRYDIANHLLPQRSRFDLY